MIARVSTWFEDEDPHTVRRWAIAAAIVVVIHVVVLCPYIYLYHPEEIGDDATPISVDLSPSDDTVDQAEVAPTPEQPPPQEVQPPPPPPPPPEPPQAVVETPPPPPPKVEEQQAATPPIAARTKGGAPHVTPTWASALNRRLLQFKRYPNEARAHNQVGVVLVGFIVDRDGHLLSRQVVHSSGYAALDKEAMDLLDRAQPLPAFPPTMTETQLDLTIPIEFNLVE
jgi:periplasmic protein TonB